MNTIINRYLSPAVMALACAFAFTLASCNKSELNGVDLRFEEAGKMVVEDLYERTADDTTPIKIIVRSDQPWKVSGNKDWYTITPSEGEANFDLVDEEGNPIGTEVTIVCNENVELDDREDLISIESGEWVGKTFTLRQKGIAYLRADNLEFNGTTAAGSVTFQLSTNQPYTVEITEGQDWLRVTENATGGSPKVEETFDVKLEYNANLGEERVGKATLFDRDHNEATKVDVLLTQEGITLVPSIPENGYYKIVTHEASVVEIPVESNSTWSVFKEKEEDDWYGFEIVDFDGNATLRVNLSENNTSAVRVVNLKLQTNIEGAQNVTKTVQIKQANLPQTQVFNMTSGDVGTWDNKNNLTMAASEKTWFRKDDEISKTGFAPGTFKLTVSGMSATSAPYLFLQYKTVEDPEGEHEIRIKFNDVGRPYWTFLTPWVFAAPQVNNWCVNNIGAIDNSKENVMEIRLSRFETDKPATAKVADAIRVEWFFNGVHCHTAMTDGISRNGSGISPSGQAAGNPAYAQPYLSTMRVKIGCATSGCFIHKFEYTPNVDWGD